MYYDHSSRRRVLNRAEIHKKSRLKIHWNWITRTSWNNWIGIHVYWIGKRSYRQLYNLSTVTNHWLYEIELSSIDPCIACFENSGRSFRKNTSRAVQTKSTDNMTTNASVCQWVEHYTAAPEMKNHLSYIPSMGAGGRSSPLLMWRAPGSSLSGEWWTLTLALL